MLLRGGRSIDTEDAITSFVLSDDDFKFGLAAAIRSLPPPRSLFAFSEGHIGLSVNEDEDEVLIVVIPGEQGESGSVDHFTLACGDTVLFEGSIWTLQNFVEDVDGCHIVQLSPDGTEGAGSCIDLPLEALLEARPISALPTPEELARAWRLVEEAAAT
jgi:hypothetical protein